MAEVPKWMRENMKKTGAASAPSSMHSKLNTSTTNLHSKIAAPTVPCGGVVKPAPVAKPRPAMPKVARFADGGEVDEAALKKEGLAISNKEASPSFWERMKDGNIDDPKSAAYWKYGAGRAMDERRRKAAEDAGRDNLGDNSSEWDAGRKPMMSKGATVNTASSSSTAVKSSPKIGTATKAPNSTDTVQTSAIPKIEDNITETRGSTWNRDDDANNNQRLAREAIMSSNSGIRPWAGRMVESMQREDTGNYETTGGSEDKPAAAAPAPTEKNPVASSKSLASKPSSKPSAKPAPAAPRPNSVVFNKGSDTKRPGYGVPDEGRTTGQIMDDVARSNKGAAKPGKVEKPSGIGQKNTFLTKERQDKAKESMRKYREAQEKKAAEERKKREERLRNRSDDTPEYGY